jgi:integrase
MARRNLPGYLKYKTTGQAFCVINGRFFYLGKYGSKASREEYERIIAEYLNNGKKLPPTRNRTEITIEELVIQYLEHAEKYYSNNGKPTETFNQCKLALEPLIRHYGKNAVSEFGPRSLLFIRDKWVENGIARKTINRWTGIIKQMFQWGVTYELDEANIYHALKAVPNLKLGRTTAPEYEEVPPIDLEIVAKTIPFLPPIVADMVRVQLFAGMRPQDVRNLRGCDIDRSGDI